MKREDKKITLYVLATLKGSNLRFIQVADGVAGKNVDSKLEAKNGEDFSTGSSFKLAVLSSKDKLTYLVVNNSQGLIAVIEADLTSKQRKMFDPEFVMVSDVGCLSASTAVMTLHSKQGTISRILEVSQGTGRLNYEEEEEDGADY